MTQKSLFSEESFKYLQQLEVNNTREWFHANKTDFQNHCEEPFLTLLNALTFRLSDLPRPLIGNKKTMFRMNRDTRFSKDPTPYKTSISGVMTPSGTKSEMSGVLYIHFSADDCFIVAGFYNLSPKQLGPIRDAMIERPDRFDQVKQSLEDTGRELDRSMSLTAMPKGYTEHGNHRHADALKLKSLMVREDLPHEDWLSGDIVEKIDKLARDTQPLLNFSDLQR